MHLDGGAMEPWFMGARPIRRGAAGMEEFQLHLPLLLGLEDVIAVFTTCGAQVPTKNRLAVCFRTTATAMPGATSRSGFPPVLEKPATSSRPRPLPEFTDNFAAQIRLQECQRRDHHRCRIAARLHDVLETGAAARLQAEVASIGKAICSRSRLRRSARTATAFRRKCGGRRTIHSNRRHRHECERSRASL